MLGPRPHPVFRCLCVSVLALALLAHFACDKDGGSGEAAGASRSAAAEPSPPSAALPVAGAAGPAPAPSKAGSPTQAAPPARSTGSSPPAKVALLTPGKSPRKPLRYSLPSASFKQKIGMTMTMAMDMQMGAGGQSVKMRLPPIRMEMELSVAEKLSDQEVRCKFAVTGADVLAGGDPMFDAMRGTLKSELQKAVGVGGGLIVNHRGVNRKMELALPPDMGQQMRQTMESSWQAMDQLSSPLPEEPIGLGARWQVDQLIEQNGLKLKQKTIFELVKLKGSKGVLKTTITQTADPQITSLPNIPAGFTAELLSHSGSGTGEVDLDLTGLAPRAATVSIKTDTAIKVTGQGQNQNMQMKADTKVDISRI